MTLNDHCDFVRADELWSDPCTTELRRCAIVAPASPDGPPPAEIFDAAPDAVIGVTAEGTIAFANRQVEALFGYPASALIGQPVEKLLPERLRDVHHRHRATYQKHPVSRPMGASLDLAGRRADGSEFPVDISLALVDTPAGPIATAFVRDVSERRRTEAMFRGLLAAAPDAIVVVDDAGVIQVVNKQVEALFGYTSDELVGRSVELLVPERSRSVHPQHRADYALDPHPRAMSAGELTAQHKNGSEFPVEIALAPFQSGDGLLVSAAIRDISVRRAAERAAQELRESQLRRRQALEINDNVVQGLATAAYALESDDNAYALAVLRTTLEAARQMMDGLLADAVPADGIADVSLLREQPAVVLQQQTTPTDSEETRRDLIRLLVADDTPDMRLLLRLSLGEDEGFDVVAEAADGEAAVAAATEQQPDVVLIDLAMPVMDGLTAIPLIRAACPQTKIVVLSGYGSEEIIDRALKVGADAYVTKGRPLESLATLLHELCPRDHVPPSARPSPLDAEAARTEEERQAAQDLALAITAHELATPVTVFQGMVQTLQRQMDVLPSPVVRELLESMSRQAQHMSDVLAILNDARHISRETLQIDRQIVDIDEIVAGVVTDLRASLSPRSVVVHAGAGVEARADAARLRQVVTNLVTNAAKFSPPDTSIEVTTSTRGATVEVTVTDHGVGIPTEQRARLFTKFTRLTSDTPGMGLGLYIARGIVRAHGGELRLVRSDQSGTTFAFELPVAADAAVRR